MLGEVGEAVVVGAGFIGLEFAAVDAKRGIRVRVVELARRPLARAVSPAMSELFHEAHARWGTSFLFGAGVARIVGEGGRA